MSGFARKIQRQKSPGRVVGEISKATKQITDLNEILQHLPEVSQKLSETRQILDVLVDDYQNLADELGLMKHILRRAIGLTPEQEDQYRSEYVPNETPEERG